jgi:hypothetical protein
VSGAPLTLQAELVADGVTVRLSVAIDAAVLPAAPEAALLLWPAGSSACEARLAACARLQSAALGWLPRVQQSLLESLAADAAEFQAQQLAVSRVSS